MKIIFLGSSHGVPEPHRKCSSALIEVGENRYFIDMGTQSIEQLVTRNIPVESVKCVFITHMHGDHTNGIISFLDLCSWYYKNADPTVFLPGDTQSAEQAISSWLKCNGTSLRPFKFCTVQEGEVYDDGVIRVTAFQTKHIDFSYAYLVEAQSKRILFSGDMCHQGPQEDFPISVLDEPLDLAICEAAHFEATKFLPIFTRNKNLKRLCFNHYSDRFLESVLSVKRSLPEIPVFRVCDDMEITL